MTQNKLSIAGIFAGFIFMIASISRYYVRYPDMDKALSYTLIGLLIMAVSYLYDCKVKTNERIIKLEEIDALRDLEDAEEADPQ